MKSVIYIVLFTLIATYSCNKSSKFTKHENGFEYKLEHRAEVGLSPRIGDIVTIRVKISSPDNKVIKQSPYLKIQVKKSKYKGSIDDALMYMHEGDSISFLIDALNYYKYDERTAVPKNLNDGDKLRFDIRLLKVQSIKELEEERRQRGVSGKYQEKIVLKDFLKNIALNDTVSLDKIYYKQIKKGKGKKPSNNDIVTINYFGYFVDGKPFDNTYERNKPFTFQLNSKSVIKGMEQGVKNMRVGEKGTLIIPSNLAYGAKGLPEAKIAPYTTLVFDIELIKIEKAK